ncbi:MAG: cyclic lactone autoinducer peptide [Lachnospiraceae bacterium]|nr:cyclic lactone autoinducer peptide [Lachnospiraceae bacterium]MDE6233683.1 cyclic lactone autoinducer peptide [Lachnospiraceae bacterium]MDE6252876.1 cyclic lactone autoinducer peptide [Lachnospiraceae bacterium]
MGHNNLSKPIAKGVASALNTLLRVDANSTSCVVVYQPKAPKELARFRSTK